MQVTSLDVSASCNACSAFIEDGKMILDKITTFWTYTILRAASITDIKFGLCNPLLPEVSSNQCETLHSCFKHTENVHVTF